MDIILLLIGCQVFTPFRVEALPPPIDNIWREVIRTILCCIVY